MARPKPKPRTPGAVWDRQPGESMKAFAAFRIFLELGPSRTIEATAREYGRSVTQVNRHSTANHWFDRAAAYDNHQASVRDAARERVMAEEAGKWERRRLEALEADFARSRLLEQRIDAMLNFPMTTRRTEDNGKTIIVQPAKWTYASLATLIKAAAERRDNAINESLFDRELREFNPEESTAEECKAFVERQRAKRKALDDAFLKASNPPEAGS